MADKIKEFRDYKVRKDKEKIKLKSYVLENAINLFEIRSEIIEAYEKGMFPLSNAQKEQVEKKEKTIKKTIPDWILVSKDKFEKNMKMLIIT